MNIQLSDHFTYKKLLQFTIPSIGMMIFISVYGVVDGIFSMLIYVMILAGLVLTVVGLIFMRPVAILLRAAGEMIEYCVLYGRILTIGLIPFMLQSTFQSFLIAAEKPNLGLAVTVAAGVTNIVLDVLFVAVFRWGLVGAARATTISQVVGGIIPLVYFLLPNTSLLRLGKPLWTLRALLKTCTNGSSEMMTNLSMSLVSMLYNFQLMNYAGEDGIAAYGVIMYVNFIFIAVFLGYSIGVAPVISFHYGAGNTDELKGLRKKSLRLVLMSSLCLTLAAELLAGLLAGIFVSYDAGLLAMTMRAFCLYSLEFLVCGFNILGSSFFTALGNGLASALISFLRTLLFQVGAVLMLPVFLGLDGIWLAIVAAEVLALGVTLFFFVKMRKRYRY